MRLRIVLGLSGLLLSSLAFAQSNSSVVALTTYAGGGDGDGFGTEARVGTGGQVALDSAGNLFVADRSLFVVRKISPTGMVSTLAGRPGTRGDTDSTDGTGATARFGDPFGIAVDGAGNLFVTDRFYHTVKRISLSGAVTTLAGLAGNSGSADGRGLEARFNGPAGLALDDAGNLYVADSGNHTLRKITPAGEVTTLAGEVATPGNSDGSGRAARFFNPLAVTLGPGGAFYVSDTGNHLIRRVTTAGVVSTLTGRARPGTSVDGAVTVAALQQPIGIAADPSSDALYVVEFEESTVRRVEMNGSIRTIAGRANTRRERIDGLGTDARLNSPVGLAATASELFVFESGAIRKGTFVPADSEFTSRLINVSVRSVAGTGDETLIVGFVVSGAGEKSVLARAIGQGLTQYGVGNVAEDPSLRLQSGNTVVVENDNWGGIAALEEVTSRVGAFELSRTSRDAVALATTSVGGYTVQVSAAQGKGVVLAELYDADSSTSSARFANISARSMAGLEDNALIAGFAVRGLSNKRLLIRGVGPRLAGFGVGNVVADPVLRLYRGSELIAENDNWAGSAGTAAASVGAFELVSRSRDAALVITVPPGSYTAHVYGANRTTGQALVEVYELP